MDSEFYRIQNLRIQLWKKTSVLPPIWTLLFINTQNAEEKRDQNPWWARIEQKSVMKSKKCGAWEFFVTNYFDNLVDSRFSRFSSAFWVLMNKSVQIGGKTDVFFQPKVRNVGIKSVFFILGHPLRWKSFTNARGANPSKYS